MPDCGQLLKEFWYLPRAHWNFDGNLAKCRPESRYSRQYGFFEPPKLLLSTRSRRAAGYDDTWASELEDTRLSMLNLRQQLADELRQRTNSDRFDFIARHRGMFSRLGVSPEVVETMRADNGVYMVGDSRINIAE